MLKSIRDENLKVIPQEVVKSALMPESDPRNACWDLFVTESGRCFLTICAELHVAAKVSLYEYKYETNELVLCFNLADKVCQFPDAISTSKIHTSMCELPDGRIIMTTHTTAQSPEHPYWHPEPFYNHTFEGFQGSTVLIYNPDNGVLENMGVPVPHESIYGAKYDKKKNALYFTGYFRGHIYRLDLDTCCVHDYGQTTEFGSFCVHIGTDDNIYSSSRSGNFFRINTDTQEIEDLGIFFPKDFEPYSTIKHTTLNYIVNGIDGNMYLAYIFSRNIYRFNPKTLELTSMGSCLPESAKFTEPYAPFTLVFDKNGVLWYALSSFDKYYQMTGCQLCRWDILRGGRPKNMGILGTVDHTVFTPSEAHYKDGIMYIGDSNHNFDPPGVMAVDLDKLDAIDYDIVTADLPFAKDIMSYTILEEPEKFYKYSSEEYHKQKNHHQFFYDYMEGYNKFLGENPLSVVCKNVKIYPFWKEYGAGKATINNISYKDGAFIAEFGNDDKKYCFNSVDETVLEISDFSLKDNRFIESLKGIDLPNTSGRNFKAVLTAAVEMSGDRYFVGTQDGLLGVWNGEDMFGLGSCPNCSGEVVDLSYCCTTDTVYGIIGGKHDIGIVFSYNDKNGVKFLGRMNYTADNGLASSYELSCICVSEDGKKLAVGNKDRLGVLYILDL